MTEHTHMHARFVKAFLLRSKPVLILWLQSLSTVILEPQKIKSVIASIFSPSLCHEVMGWMPWSSFFEGWVLSQNCHSPISPISRDSLVPLHFLPFRVVSPAYLRLLFLLAILVPACDSFSPTFCMSYSA